MEKWLFNIHVYSNIFYYQSINESVNESILLLSEIQRLHSIYNVVLFICYVICSSLHTLDVSMYRLWIDININVMTRNSLNTKLHYIYYTMCNIKSRNLAMT